MIKKYNFNKPMDFDLSGSFENINDMVTMAVDEIAYKQDQTLYDFLYQEFLKANITSRVAVILNKDEFKKFIDKYLPIYVKEMK